MIQDKSQALDDLLAGWKNYVFDGLAKRYDAYPAEYVSFLERLYYRATDALLARTDPADFIRDTLLPLFDGEAVPHSRGEQLEKSSEMPVYPPPWTLKTVFERFARLRAGGAVQWSTTLQDEEARARLNDAITQGQRLKRTDKEVIDDALLLYLSRGGTQAP